jgi:hypothetical protein
MTSLAPFRPRRTRLLSKPDQKVSAWDGLQADDLTPAVSVDRHGNYRRERDDPAAFALPEVGGVEPRDEAGRLVHQLPLPGHGLDATPTAW